MKISGFVIAYNRMEILETCLQSIRWVDELIVVDKSSTDATPEIAKHYADRYLNVPWSPTVEETRAYALDHTAHNFIVFLDDDECLSVEAAKFLRSEAKNPRAKAYSLACRHYILGEHSEGAYYWPESHIRAFVRGAVQFHATVHGGHSVVGEVYNVPQDAGICFHNFSHPDVATWIEKTNRYTGSHDRVAAVSDAPEDMRTYARERLDYWLNQRPNSGSYADKVAILRAIYDIVDILKLHETERELSGEVMFEKVMAQLRREYQASATGDFSPE